jgi:hypothetical protein
MRTHHAHPDSSSLNLIFEPNRFEQVALEAAYQHVVPRIRRATAAVAAVDSAGRASREGRRASA